MEQRLKMPTFVAGILIKLQPFPDGSYKVQNLKEK